MTGGTGFVGSHLLERLVTLGYDDVRVPVRTYRSVAAAGRFPVQMIHTPLLDPTAVRDAIDGARYVFHLAFDWLRPLVSGDPAAMAMGARASRNGVAIAR